MSRTKKSPATRKLLTQFCKIILPQERKDNCYINLRTRIAEKGIDTRTFYLWKAGEVAPLLETMVKMLDEKGYELQIVLKKDAFN